MKKTCHILVYGYGNPGREDDGLGIELVNMVKEWVEEEQLAGIECDSNYQLNIEDAETISDKELVIFADASTEAIDDFMMTEIDGEYGVSFTTHAASPGYIVKLCSELFGSSPKAMLLHIKGYRWSFKEGLSEKGKENLSKAFEYVKNYIANTQINNNNDNNNHLSLNT